MSNSSTTHFTFLSLFPEVIEPSLTSSLMGKAKARGFISTRLIQIRDFAEDRHHKVDDTVYGGGPGMLMKPDVLYRAWKAADPDDQTLTVLLSPQGKRLDHALAKRYAAASHRKFIFVCGHYEGIDERFVEVCVDEEVSVGDFVVTGGELPAALLADAIARLIPGVVGKEESIANDSLGDGRLKYPQYTKPRKFMDLEVPDVLLSGDHAKIRAWREREKVQRTRERRPDLKV